MKLWGSRMAGELDPAVARLNASFDFDIRLYRQDIRASQAWARSLAEVDLLSAGELKEIVTGLEQVLDEFSSGSFEPTVGDEDIHTAVERRLTELIGPTAGKLHTGRSRNDQVATDFRLWTMEAAAGLAGHLLALLQALADSAEGELEAPMPGYTHLQPAQPITWGHWAMAHAWPLLRDVERLAAVRKRSAVLPLGSGALAGTSLAIDRAALAERLGFEQVSRNSIDAVSDRDFATGFLYACALTGVHLSRLAEQLILFASAEFGFVRLDPAFTTGSSLMPQKANPDPLELARGKSGRLIGNLIALLTTLKGLPSVYDKDLQEDKEPAFDSFDTLAALLPVLTGLVQGLELQPEAMAARIEPALFATDLADYLVERGVPFREAHDRVGQAVRRAEELGVPLDELELEQLQAIDARFEPDALQVFDVKASLAKRRAPGGTAPERLQEQLAALRTELQTWRQQWQDQNPPLTDRAD